MKGSFSVGDHAPHRQYQKHQRDYTVLGTSVVFAAYCSRAVVDYFLYTPLPIFILVRDGILFHLTAEEDSCGRARAWVKQSSIESLRRDTVRHNATLARYRAFLSRPPADPASALQELHLYFAELLSLILVAIEVPEYASMGLDPAIRECCFQIRRENEDVYKVGMTRQQTLLAALEKKLGKVSGTLAYLTNNEFQRFLSNGGLPGGLAERKAFLLVRHTAEGEEVFRDPMLVEQFGLEETHKGAVTDPIRGMSASPGMVRGNVRIVRLVADAQKIQDGEVLVASMTDPRYLPAMKRAAAIVTDEGGITSHAAIVSRELKKPCIIATKIATKVLKDGDEVEVDANKGIVKILKRA